MGHLLQKREQVRTANPGAPITTANVSITFKNYFTRVAVILRHASCPQYDPMKSPFSNCKDSQPPTLFCTIVYFVTFTFEKNATFCQKCSCVKTTLACITSHYFTVRYCFLLLCNYNDLSPFLIFNFRPVTSDAFFANVDKIGKISSTTFCQVANLTWFIL